MTVSKSNILWADVFKLAWREYNLNHFFLCSLIKAVGHLQIDYNAAIVLCLVKS